MSANYRSSGGRLGNHADEGRCTVTSPGLEVVYDNTTNLVGWSIGTGPDGATGNQITLGGSGRVVTEFRFGYVSDTDIPVTVTFWANDGSEGAPGTCLFDSGPVVAAA